MKLEQLIGQFSAYTEYPNQDTFVISNQTCQDIVKYLKQVPKAGKWVLNGGYWKCSKCREKALLKFDNFGIRTPEYIHVESNYCPNCGCRMECEEYEH